MTTVSKSPDRNTFQKNAYLERCKEDNKAPDPAYIKLWDDQEKIDEIWANDHDSHWHDLEYDLRSNQYLLDRVRASETYAQNLYAALCNMRFQKREVLSILKDEYWSCTWRSAGGIIADMRQQGDYIDWYCSGIAQLGDDGESIDTEYLRKRFVPEGTVTPEIEMDLYNIGWVAVVWPDEE